MSLAVVFIALLGLCCGFAASENICDNTDIVFLVDESGTISDAEFQFQIDFIEKLVDNFQIGPSDTQVGVVTFSNGSEHEFYLNTYGSVQDIKAHTGALMPNQQYRSHIHDGLQFVFDQLSAAAHGARAGAKKVVVIMIDGETDWPGLSQTVVADLHAMPARILILAAPPMHGQVPQILYDIAMDPGHVYEIGGFADLLNIPEDAFLENACLEPEHVCGFHDIVFLVDESGTITDQEFAQQMDFIEILVDYFPIGPTKTQVGVVTFSNGSEHEIYLNQYGSVQDIKDHTAAEIPNQQYRSHLHTGLQYVFDQLSTAALGGRGNAKKVVIIMIDGITDWPGLSQTAIDDLHAMPATILVIAAPPMHGELSQILYDIATDPANVYQIGGFGELVNIQLDFFLAKACPFTKPDCSKYGTGWIGSPITNSCYLFVKKDRTCRKARKYCRNKSTENPTAAPNGYPSLVRIETQEENDWLLQQIQAIPGNANWWIGAHALQIQDDVNNRPYTLFWDDCTTHHDQYENFIPNEPSLFHDSPETCVQMVQREPNAGKWNDVPKTKTIPFICEIPLAETVSCDGDETVTRSKGPSILDVCLKTGNPSCAMGWGSMYFLDMSQISMTCLADCEGEFVLYQ